MADLKKDPTKRLAINMPVSMRTELNRVHRITTRMVKTKTRYLITKIDQDLSPFLERLFKILGLRYNPNETRVVEEHVEEVEPTKPPDL